MCKGWRFRWWRDLATDYHGRVRIEIGSLPHGAVGRHPGLASRRPPRRGRPPPWPREIESSAPGAVGPTLASRDRVVGPRRGWPPPWPREIDRCPARRGRPGDSGGDRRGPGKTGTGGPAPAVALRAGPALPFDAPCHALALSSPPESPDRPRPPPPRSEWPSLGAPE